MPEQVIIKDLQCPACGSMDCMVTAGKAAGKYYKAFRRYGCSKCGIHTINPIEINKKEGVK